MIRATQVLNIELADGVMTSVRVLGRGPRLLFTHGSGFASDAFGPFLHGLAEKFEVVAFDLRGHGRGPAVTAADYELQQLIADFPVIVAGIQEQLGEVPVNGVFHSIGGVFALRAQIDHRLFRSMVCYEPPVGAVGEHHEVFDLHRKVLAERTRKRRTVFLRVDELARSYLRAGVVGDNQDAARILATAMLRERGEGQFELRCNPEIEAKTYATNSDFGLWNDFARIDCPGLIMAGRPGAYPANAATRIAAATGFDLERREDLGHSGWMQAPDWSVHRVSAAVLGMQ